MAPTSDPRPVALVTGLAGFTGRYVGEALEAAGYRVVGLRDPESGAPVNLLDRDGVRRVVDATAPQAVVHLAAIAFVAHGDVDAMYRVNVVGTRHLLEALAATPRQPRVVVLASSANIYGNATEGALGEDQPPAPANDYAVSKLAMEYMARLWTGRLPLVVTRPFNYTGRGQDLQFLVPKIVDHFRRDARTIELGNIHVSRDFSDVRTVAEVYRRLVETAPVGEVVNICSGTGHALLDVLGMMSRIAGYTIDVQVNPAFVRAGEVARLVGDRTRLDALVGPVKEIPLEQTLRWMYEAPRVHA